MKKFGLIALLAFAAAVFAANSEKAAYTCSLTGRKIGACCCKNTADGKLYCTLAKQTIASCCCKPVDSKAAAPSAH